MAPALPHKCWEVNALKRRPRSDEAQVLLQRLADQVEPIMRAHQWRCTKLTEFVPKNAGLLGMNVNRTKIMVRLRPAGALESFYPYEHLLGTLLHELVHMQISAHSAAFYKPVRARAAAGRERCIARPLLALAPGPARDSRANALVLTDNGLTA